VSAILYPFLSRRWFLDIRGVQEGIYLSTLPIFSGFFLLFLPLSTSCHDYQDLGVFVHIVVIRLASFFFQVSTCQSNLGINLRLVGTQYYHGLIHIFHLFLEN
jgi:hypothetical protein